MKEHVFLVMFRTLVTPLKNSRYVYLQAMGAATKSVPVHAASSSETLFDGLRQELLRKLTATGKTQVAFQEAVEGLHDFEKNSLTEMSEQVDALESVWEQQRTKLDQSHQEKQFALEMEFTI